MKKQQKDTVTGSVAVLFLFILYLIILLYLLFFSDRYGRTVGFTEYHYNLKPFAEITRYLKFRDAFSLELFLVNIVGNILAFMPFGFFLPLISKKFTRFFAVFFQELIFISLVECLQMVLLVGTFDVDDIILNGAGVILGYVAAALLGFTGGKKRNDVEETE